MRIRSLTSAKSSRLRYVPEIFSLHQPIMSLPRHTLTQIGNAEGSVSAGARSGM